MFGTKRINGCGICECEHLCVCECVHACVCGLRLNAIRIRFQSISYVSTCVYLGVCLREWVERKLSIQFSIFSDSQSSSRIQWIHFNHLHTYSIEILPSSLAFHHSLESHIERLFCCCSHPNPPFTSFASALFFLRLFLYLSTILFGRHSCARCTYGNV